MTDISLRKDGKPASVPAGADVTVESWNTLKNMTV